MRGVLGAHREAGTHWNKRRKQSEIKNKRLKYLRDKHEKRRKRKRNKARGKKEKVEK